MHCSSLRLPSPASSSASRSSSVSRRSSLRVQAVFRLVQPLISRPHVGPPSPAAKRVQQLLLSPAALADAPVSKQQESDAAGKGLTFHGVHHVALICNNLEASMAFYQGTLGLEINPDRPDDKLPYRGAWLWIGPEMIHLMELPNPDPNSTDKRPEHGGRDRHFCIGVASVDKLAALLDTASVPYTRSMSGRPAIFFRDPDANTLECVEVDPWR